MSQLKVFKMQRRHHTFSLLQAIVCSFPLKSAATRKVELILKQTYLHHKGIFAFTVDVQSFDFNMQFIN